MQDNKLEIYKELRQKMSVSSVHRNSCTGDITCSITNIEYIRDGMEIGIISNVLENNRAVIRDSDIKQGKKYQITLNSRISFDLTDYLSETDVDFTSHFSKKCEIPKNLYIHSINKEAPDALKIFEHNLIYAHNIYLLLDNIYSYKNEEVNCTEFFIFSTQPLTIRTIYTRSKLDFSIEVKELISLVNTDLKREIYKPLLRMEIVNFLRLIPENDRFRMLMENFNSIYTNFTNSLAIYVSQFSFDNFKDVFQKEKEKYFNSVREIVNRAYSQIITIPISIGAVVFATSKITEKNDLIIKLVYGSFIMYVIYYIIIQSVYLLDLIDLKREFKADFDLIKLKSGLQEDILQRKVKQIEKKFMISILISTFLILMVAVLGVLVCIYINSTIAKNSG